MLQFRTLWSLAKGRSGLFFNARDADLVVAIKHHTFLLLEPRGSGKHRSDEILPRDSEKWHGIVSLAIEDLFGLFKL